MTKESTTRNASSTQTTVISPVIQNAAAGLSSGVTGTVIGYPLDLLKTRLQVTSKDQKKGSPKTHLLKMSANILRTEGIRGLYKGLMAPLVSISFISTVTFASYTWIRPKIGAQSGWDYRNAISATLTAPIMCPITTVEGLVRTQMQVDNINKNQYKGSWHCLSSITRLYGPSTLFTGTTITVLRDAAFLAAYFFVYEGMKVTLTGSKKQANYTDQKIDSANNNINNLSIIPNVAIPSELAVPLAGGTAGAMAWLTSFPFDCVRAGVQGQDLETMKHHERKTGKAIFEELMQSRGIRGLYRGVSAAVMRAFLVSSTRFSAYEITLWLFRQNQDAIE